MDNLEWAASWVGWGNMDGYTDADLAEAVRVKYLSDPRCESHTFPSAETIAFEWLDHGPLAFIAAVREVVDG